MGRNYKKEAAWLKDKYTDLRARISKELADKLKECLTQENRSYADWLRERIIEYLGEA